MTTVKVANGDLYINSYGRPEYISDLEEASQNVGRAVLIEYDSYFDEGNELLTFVSGGSSSTNVNEMLSQQYLTECVNRLILKQRDVDIGGGNIVQVNQVKTRMVGMTTLVFLIDILFANGTTSSVVGQSQLMPTQLDHILNPSSIINV